LRLKELHLEVTLEDTDAFRLPAPVPPVVVALMAEGEGVRPESGFGRKTGVFVLIFSLSGAIML
jgi:hypothetical protein